MNVFYLDHNPRRAAHFHCDKHVSKMIVEYAQILSTAHRVIDGNETIRISKNNRRLKYWEHPDHDLEVGLYLPTHVNHPSCIWTREASANYQWLYECFIHLGKIFEFRYGKLHATIEKLGCILDKHPSNIPRRSQTPIKRAINDPAAQYCNVVDDVEAYRNFYVTKRGRMPMIWNRYDNVKPHWYSKHCEFAPPIS